MLEKFTKLEKTTYSQQDLEHAARVLHDAEGKLNSFDLMDDKEVKEVDIKDAMMAKKNWESAREKYLMISNFFKQEKK